MNSENLATLGVSRKTLSQSPYIQTPTSIWKSLRKSLRASNIMPDLTKMTPNVVPQLQ